MRSILITGGSHAELPLIESAKKLGYYVITTGNNLDGIGHRAADKYVPGDFSDKEFVLSLARNERIEGIISGCNDFAYLSSAYACEQLGLGGHDSYENACLIHSKDKFRQMTRELGIKTPRSFICKSRGDVLNACGMGFPVVVKPVDLTGGKGVVICHDADQALGSFEDAVKVTRTDHIIVEEFIHGKSYGASVMLKNHRTVCCVFGNELYYKNKYLVSGACTAADLTEKSRAALCRDIEKISSHLDLCDGLFHTQFVLSDGGDPVMIDPCRRSPGDLYIKFAKYVTQEDFPEMIVRSELGQAFSPAPERQAENYILRMCVMTDKNGIFNGTVIPSHAEEKIFDRLIWAKKGDNIDDFMKYKAGIVFLKAKDPEEMYGYFDKFHDIINIEVI